MVLGDGSVSTPPLAVPPLSWTWKVKLAYPAPLPFAAGVKTSFPPVMSATGTNCPAVTATPLSVSVPATGRVVISTEQEVGR